jgi:hypothetical protein
MLPSTSDRVHRNTHRRLNEGFHRRIHENVERHAQAHPQILGRRLAELDHEWDVDRAMETTYSAAFLAGFALVGRSRHWRLFCGAAAVSLLSHGLFGWDPLLPLYRRLGFRTSSEIARERYALKAVRGDFRHLTEVTTAEERDAIARLEGEGGPAYEGPAGSEVAEVVEAARK